MRRELLEKRKEFFSFRGICFYISYILAINLYYKVALMQEP
jgi:hypothetical protein